MDKNEFTLLFSRLTREQQKLLIKQYVELLNAHNLIQKTRQKSA